METFHLIFNSWITYVIIAFLVSVIVILVKKGFFIVHPSTIDLKYVRNTFQIELETIVYKDCMRDSIVLHPVIGAESLSQLENWTESLITKEENLKHSLREYFLTVKFKEVDRLAIEEIIKENFLGGGTQLNYLKIDFASVPESLKW